MPTTLSGHTLLNTARVKAWRVDGPTQGKCVWQQHSVWEWDEKKEEGVVLQEGYFRVHPGSKEPVSLFDFGW
jgi:hypothetical protein